MIPIIPTHFTLFNILDDAGRGKRNRYRAMMYLAPLVALALGWLVSHRDVVFGISLRIGKFFFLLFLVVLIVTLLFAEVFCWLKIRGLFHKIGQIIFDAEGFEVQAKNEPVQEKYYYSDLKWVKIDTRENSVFTFHFFLQNLAVLHLAEEYLARKVITFLFTDGKVVQCHVQFLSDLPHRSYNLYRLFEAIRKSDPYFHAVFRMNQELNYRGER